MHVHRAHSVARLQRTQLNRNVGIAAACCVYERKVLIRRERTDVAGHQRARCERMRVRTTGRVVNYDSSSRRQNSLSVKTGRMLWEKLWQNFSQVEPYELWPRSMSICLQICTRLTFYGRVIVITREIACLLFVVCQVDGQRCLLFFIVVCIIFSAWQFHREMSEGM